MIWEPLNFLLKKRQNENKKGILQIFLLAIRIAALEYKKRPSD